jgi:hypothetical protein
MMRLGTFPFRGFPLVLMFAALLLARPSNAQTQSVGVSADHSRPGSDVAANSLGDKSTKNFTYDQRFEWFIDNTAGTGSLVADAVSAGIGTGLNSPGARGGTGQSFTQRYEMHLAGASAANGMEASLGAIWSEDPRYFPVPTESFGRRLRNVIKMTFVAYRRDGNLAPAYARYLGVTGSSFLTASWEANGDANLHDAILGTLTGFLGRMGGNAFQEFWPSVKPHLLHHMSSLRL